MLENFLAMQCWSLHVLLARHTALDERFLFSHSHRICISAFQTSASSQVKNPCYHTGYSTTMSTGHIFETPCNEKTSNYNPKQQLTLVGTGDPGLCRSAVRAAFDLASCQGRSNCSFNGVYQPPVSGDFVVRSNVATLSYPYCQCQS